MSSAGLGLETFSLPAADADVDTFIVAGGRGVHAVCENPQLLSWVGGHAKNARRIASVCTGAFLLAAAGLLEDRRVVTHWAHCQTLSRRYPTLRVDPKPIYIQDGEVWTSAGVTAGIDLALAFVEADQGRALALDVARELVVFLKRPGGQAQFSAALLSQNADDDFGQLHAWIVENLASDMSIPVLAERAGMSERSFLRHYRSKTGNTPAKAIELFRTEAALRLLVDTALPAKRIAERCGFGSEDTMRRSVMRLYAVTPQAYRERFGAPSTL
jgi:transcriptional regulator GlxA family with amidase domain